MSHVVYAFLRGDGTIAVPIIATVAIHEDGTWSPIAARETPGGPTVPVELLRSDRVWWGPWARRYAAALLEAHREEQRAKDDRLGVEQVRAWINDEEVRVIRRFPAPRGYGES